jgi:hypothetical protein
VVDIKNDKGGMERLLALGLRHVPVLARGKEYVSAQNLDEVARFVGIKPSSPGRLAPAVLIDRWMLVIAGVQRHMRQMPAEKLSDFPTTGRDQNTAGLGYHAIRIGDAFLRVVNNGVQDWVQVSMEPPPPDIKTGDDIARYGDEVAARLKQWWAGWKDPTCSGKVVIREGEQPLHWFLERSVWHSAQHTRQLASLLERYGVEPDRPLGKAELEGLPMPEGIWS